MATSFEDLEVYQLACRVADLAWRCVGGWDHHARETVGTQLVRAADSVAANIAEGDGRGSDADFRRFLYIARGSLYETTHWVRTSVRRDLLSEQEKASMDRCLSELLPRLNALIRTVNHRMNSVREPGAPYDAAPRTGADLDPQ